ncbi:hypothetical protein BGW36DRAFT_328511 [Talaromyces proteolyticus]|uniref:Uncharacterized protein n=1 Tax=Talaromyces proteolyticus TaxID=1131652 RepID=A0AAD4KKM6_9EURO|nr:uncharacterized protein BGW36DRAFT_328511 [Talaromyces proteolyticus]KAH8690643.1 hypothetical protein BGW36DRAFT_328511 [Talaromyces proteolyticus]
MEFADLKPLRRWSDFPRRLTQNSRWIYIAFFAVPGLLLLFLSYTYLQPPTLAPSRTSADDQTHLAVATPSPTAELSSITLHQEGEAGASHLDHSTTPLVRPEGIRIVGVVFYGRRDRSSLLECYLRKNLASNGGWLDEVIWAANTEDKEDIAYGEEIAKTVDEYTFMPINDGGFSGIYFKAFKEPDAIYVKMDDDIVFIDQSAIPRLVNTLMNSPRALIVSSNVVNNPALGWVHYHMRAVHPYVPEVIPEHDSLSTKENGAWRASELPTWNESDSKWQMPELDNFYSLFGVNEKTSVPKHRWIPTRNLTYLYQTPVASSEYDAFGNNLQHWPLAAQAHYSLLQNMEERRLGRYFMVHGSDEEAISTWDMRGSRISINFMAVRGIDILNNMMKLKGDDEHILTVELPKQLNRAVLVETTSVVAHFAFGPQKNLIKTDLLERYHNYASEMICPNSILEPEAVLAQRPNSV